ncbi:MAG: potassium channel family protein [Candidatus Bathyarchaeia archaeon]
MVRSSIKRKDKRESKKLSFTLYRLLYGPVAFIRVCHRQLLLLLATFIFGMIIYAYYDRVSAILALFASVSTITFIGLYDPDSGHYASMKSGEAILVTVLLLLSIVAGVSLFQRTLSVETSEKARAEERRRLISRLKNHVIVYGYTYIGKYADNKLGELGYDYVVITKNRDTYDELLRDDVFVVLENKTNPVGALETAGIDKSALVIVADVDDSDNMRFILTARALRPDIKIHTVVHDPSLIQTAKNAGANIVIPASVTLGQLLAFSAGQTENLIGVVFSEKMGTQSIVESTIHKSSPLIGKKLQDTAKLAWIIGVTRDGKNDDHIFDGNFTLKEGDTLLVFGDSSKLETIS